jgi:hypothetical protein
MGLRIALGQARAVRGRGEPPAELGDEEAEHDPESAPGGAVERDPDALVVHRADRQQRRGREQHNEPEVAARVQREEAEGRDALSGDRQLSSPVAIIGKAIRAVPTGVPVARWSARTLLACSSGCSTASTVSGT